MSPSGVEGRRLELSGRSLEARSNPRPRRMVTAAIEVTQSRDRTRLTTALGCAFELEIYRLVFSAICWRFSSTPNATISNSK